MSHVLRSTRPSRVILEERERASRSELETAIFASSNKVIPSSEESVSNAAHQLKVCIKNYEYNSRELTQWLRDHGHIAETRSLRQERHKLIYSESKECIDDLNLMLADLKLDAVSNVDAASVSTQLSTRYERREALSEDASETHTHQDEDASAPGSALDHGVTSEVDPRVPSQSIVVDESGAAVPQQIETSVYNVQNKETATINNFMTNEDHTVVYKLQPSVVNEENFISLKPNQKLNAAAQVFQPPATRSCPNTVYASKPPVSRTFMSQAPSVPLTAHQTPSALHMSPSIPSKVAPIFHSHQVRYGDELPVTHPNTYQYSAPPIPLKYQFSTPHNNQRLDPSTRHLVKQDLLRGSSSKFEGDPQQFLSWRNNLQRRLEESEADSMDSIHIILANTDKRPKNMVQNFISAGISNPDATLHDIWVNLEKRFATPNRIAEGLIGKISSVPPIKNQSDISKLEDLLDLCKIVHTNMCNCPELGIFNLSYGMKSVWEKLPDSFQSKWRSRYLNHEEQTGSNPDFGLFIEFYEHFLRDVSHPSFLNNNSTRSSTIRNIRTLVTVGDTSASDVSDKPFCIYHNNSGHLIVDCKAFSRLSYPDRKQFVVSNKLCFICLDNHFANKCPNKSKIKCDKCDRSHVDVMHNENTSVPFSNLDKHSKYSPFNNQYQGGKFNNFEARNSCTALCGSDKLSKVCSKTIPIELTVEGQMKTLRGLCIIDEQSNTSFCDPKVISYFNLKPSQIDYILSTLTGKRTISGSLVSNLRIKGINKSNWLSLPQMLTHPNLPNTKNEVATSRIVAAHPHIRKFANCFSPLHANDEVLILLGANSGEFMRTRAFGSRAPFIHETPLGYALVGPTCLNVSSNPMLEVQTLRTSVVACDHQSAKITFAPPHRQKSDFTSPFNLHVDDELRGLSQEDRKFQEIMENGISVNELGNLRLPLPLKEDVVLPDNEATVYHRTKNTLDRLKRSPLKLQESLKVFDSYLKAGHVEQLKISDIKSPNPINHIPIFPVHNEEKQKTRLVFDSSSCLKGVSLNHALLQGPDLNNSLLGVLLRFRLEEVAVNADIERMFHSFFVDPKHVDLLRFFWFRNNNPNEDIVPYRALVHVFGNKPSPAIASFALKYTTLSPDLQEKNEVCDFIRNHFYVDDALYSSESTSKAIEILSQARDVLAKYNIRLHKIMSSHQEVMNAFPESELSASAAQLELSSESDQNKTLGVVWSPSSDTLSLSPNVPSRPFTKRGILAVTSSVYDPIGLVSPTTLKGRLLQRKIITSKDQLTPELEACDWDDQLPRQYFDEWSSWMSSLRDTRLLQIPRCYKPKNFGRIARREIHCFADASDEAIGFVMYLRQVNESGIISVAFLYANSKVAPRAAGTIPRLELCAALDASKSVAKISIELNIDIDNVYYYTDSKIVIGYLNNSTKRFARYVSRRVTEILSLGDKSQWYHIEGAKNIGDMASRPQTLRALLESEWLTGPTFLHSPLILSSSSINHDLDLPEVRSNKTELKRNSTCNPDLKFVCSRTTSWYRARSIIAHVLKFLHLLRKCSIQSGCCKLCNLDFDKAASILINDSQSAFSTEITALSTNGKTQTSGPLSDLSPFVDVKGTLRVGGRLRDSNFPADVKHPILLSAEHPVTLMIIQDCHEQTKHQGRYMTLGRIRLSGYHILKGNSTVKKFIRNCLTCRRLRGPMQCQVMADLPPDRLEECAPFTNVGIDIFGPYLVHDGKSTRRVNATKKTWGLIITCLVSRAVHIEMVPFMDTSSLQLALRRFFAIRGNCKRIRSDQGTNLIGTRNDMIDVSQLRTEAHKQGVEWALNPPCASNWGGVWERKIGVIKRIMEGVYLTASHRSFSRDELNTYLQECACIINNTPLWETSSSPDDPAPISPANILTLRDSPNPPPSEDFSREDLLRYGRVRWRRVEYLCDEFWRRWRQHYVSNLQKRTQWKTPNLDIKIDDLVLVKSNCKRNVWPIGRISSTRKGRDNLVRSVVIQLPRKDGSMRMLERSIRDTVLLQSATLRNSGA